MSLRGTPCVLGQQQRDISCRHCRQCRLQVQRIYSMLSSNIHHYFTLFATFCRPGAAGFYLHFQQLVRWRAISLRVLGSFFIHFLHFMIFFFSFYLFFSFYSFRNSPFTNGWAEIWRDLTRSSRLIKRKSHSKCQGTIASNSSPGTWLQDMARLAEVSFSTIFD